MLKKIITTAIAILIVFSGFGQKEKFDGRVDGFVPNGYVEMYERGEKKLKLFPEDFRMDQPEIGSKFPSFSFVDINGDSITSEMLEGKIALLNFTFVGCSGCKMEQFTLEKITNMYADREDIVFINFINSAPWRIKWYLNRFGEKGYISVPIDKETYKDYFHIGAAPTHMFLVDGIVRENISAPLWSEDSYKFITSFIDKVD
ncbi:MAG: TlpA family protein disulfide reductase [Bacteroidota bacterium]